MLKHDNLFCWRIFVTVAYTGSVSKTAEIFKMEPSNVSRELKNLALSLGQIELFTGGQPLKLSPIGKVILEHAKRLIDSHESLLNCIQESFNNEVGKVSVGLPPGFFDWFLLEPYLSFHKEREKIELEISDYRQFPVTSFAGDKDEFDLIVGYGDMNAKVSETTKILGSGCHIPVASPAYIKEHGMPKSISDLSHHTLIILNNFFVRPNGYFLETGEHNIFPKFKSVLPVCSPVTAMKATLLGGGIHYGLPALYCYRYILSGELVPITGIWENPTFNHILYVNPKTAFLNRVNIVRCFIENSIAGNISDCHAMLKRLGLLKDAA
jgi:DNA-binding transcriptional LysR family regulator